MATAAPPFTPDRVVELHLQPGMLGQFRQSLAEGGPRIKCFRGSLTLVSPGLTHETRLERLGLLIVAVCDVLRIPIEGLGSTYYAMPGDAGDTGYEPDLAYYVQSFGKARPGQVPDLAIEVVVSNPAKKAMAAGEFLGIPEMWVYDVLRHRLSFFRLPRRGPNAGSYQPLATSRALPILSAAEVLERLDDAEKDLGAFQRSCRAWARRVLRGRQPP